MGNKKRNVAPRSKPSSVSAPPLPVVSGDGAASDGSPTSIETVQNLTSNSSKIMALIVESDPSSHSAVKLECERALTSLRRGNHTKALRLMKEMCLRYDHSAHSALIHRVQGTVSVKVASIIDDTNAKQRHLKNAIESAKKAVSLSPNSIEFSHFYANLLYEAANDAKEYEQVVQECERGLAIEYPVDPAKESLQEEKEQKIPTADARIEHVHNELQSLIQKSNIASLSTWMKNLGNGEERIRFIPIRRATEDPMEARSGQARRPNEIKKANKTPEERRKEIEVRVAAARLLQQKSESTQLQNDENKALDSSLGSGQRAGERRKSGNTRKGTSSAERKNWVRSYWDSMTLDMKKNLLTIRISEVKTHLNSSKDGLANEVLSEALSFGEVNKTWKFWSCCRCSEKFADSESHMQHVVQEHMGNLMPKMQSVLPQNVDNEWIEMLLNCSWKPLDINAAINMLEYESKFQTPELVSESHMRNDAECCKDGLIDNCCTKDELGSSPLKAVFSDSSTVIIAPKENHGKISDIAWSESDGNHGRKKAYFIPDTWPLSDDAERGKLLERISATFEVLIKNKCLAASHLSKVFQFAVDDLQGLAFGSQLLNCGVDRTPTCICFLGAPELKKILKFLQDLSHSCGLGRYPERNTATDDSDNGAQAVEITERIVLNEDASCLQLDELALISGHENVTENAAEVTSGIAGCENEILLDADALLSWIFTGPTSGEQLELWTRNREEKAHQGVEILQMLEKEFYHLQSMCEIKCDHLSYEEALQAVEDLCLEERKKMEHGQSYESVLRKRRELIESDSDVVFISNRFELDAISNVLKEAETLNINQFGLEDTCSGVPSELRDLESGEDDNLRMKERLDQVDSCIEAGIRKQKDLLSVELSKSDVRIMRNMAGMQQLELKLESISAYDYRSILVPLVKSFMRAHLEDLAEKDATEKSDAAREAFLAELALDSKRGISGGSENSRHTQEKSKDKKKNKEYRKTKDSKAVGNNEPHMLQRDTSESDSVAVTSDGEYQEPEIVVLESEDALKQQEEEFRRKMELEAEERKLEETLEYQRRIENEAKQKHLAKQHKRAIRTIPEKMPVGIPDVYLNHNEDHKEVFKSLKHCNQEQLMQKNGFPNIIEGVPIKTVDKASQRISSGHSHCSSTVKEGLPNGVLSEDNVLALDKQTGRKGKRQKNSTKSVDGRCQTGSSEKENTEVGQVRVKDSLNGDNYNHYLGDNETKTLRQLQAEEDDEERFQADLKQAVCQSLDTFHAHQNLPSISSSRKPQKMYSEIDDLGVSPSGIMLENVNGIDVFGTGLKNEVGEYNCFLNVIIQSLWHLRRFRDEFLRSSKLEHVHVGDPCVTCALYDIFIALSMASTDTHTEAVAPTSLRIALSNLYPDSNFFQEAQMNDASEVLGVIFNCLHQSFTSGSAVSDTVSVESNCMDSWDCSNGACVAHSLFGMDIFERMNCYNCSLESRHLKYTSFFHNINSSALRTMKVSCAEGSFDELLNLVEMNHLLACDPEAGGCGKLNYIHHILSSPPHVFTTVLGWQNTCESVDDIAQTLGALATEIDISVLYRGLDPKNRHRLVSVVCYYGQHYHCFAYSHDVEQWVMYDDKTVKVIGHWDDVLSMCKRGHLQPQVLFFEAVN